MRSIRLLNAFSYENSHFMFYTLCPNTFDRHLYKYSQIKIRELLKDAVGL